MTKGDKTMRRHVETQIENPEKERVGITIFFFVWVLALLLLTATARGQEAGKSDAAQQLPQQAVAQKHPHRLPAPQPKKPKRPKAEEAVENKSQQADSGDQETLTRFILISIPDRRLALVDNGEVVKVYPIAVGASHSPSPDGNFTVISHVSNPSWTHKGKVVAPGKDNPVGSRWMGLSLKGYGIHGTNAPRSIGKAASHGCFRMGKKDVEELFKLVHVGDTVAVRGERDELVAQVFGATDSNAVQVASAAAAVPAEAGQD
ncbi:MAG TPA: L,D-transpeptidase [Candidatus Angelobacter sp.]